MSKLTSKITVPFLLAGVFTSLAFLALNYERLDPQFVIVFFFILIYIFFYGLATGQNIASPVKKILERAEELSKGNLSSRVYLETKDEFSDLARAFNTIAEELEASRDQGSRAEKEVSVKVRAKTKEMEETINALEQKIKNRTLELEKILKELNVLHEDVKNKEVETGKLKEELAGLKQKSAGKRRAKIKETVIL